MTQERTAIHLADYEPPRYLIDNIELNFKLSPKDTVVHASLTLRRNPASLHADASCTLDGEDLELVNIKLNDRDLSSSDYIVTSTGLLIHQVPEQFTLETTVKVQPVDNTKLEGLYLSNGNFATQCEPHGFRRITYYIDRPDVMATFKTSIRADKKLYPVLLSNGNPSNETTHADGSHSITWDDPFKKPSYLFALVAGNLKHISDTFVTASKRHVDLKIYVEPGNEDKCQHAMDSLKHAMRWDEEKFGREYDLDIFNIVAVSDFNMGAMENKSLNIFNTKYILAKPETATDQDYSDIECVIGHEYFHNWTGNRITCRDWFQLSLKEGLTVFRDQEFSMDMNSRDVYRIHDARTLKQTQFPEDSGPTAHPVRPESYIEVNNFYTATVYNKGAEVIRMLKTIVGESKFRRGMDVYFERYDGQAVTIEELISSIEAGAGVSLPQFRLWYSQAGTPTVKISTEFNRNTHEYTVSMGQSTPATPGQNQKAPFMIPVKVALFSREGKFILEKMCCLTEESQSFAFSDIQEPPVLSVLRDFSAPVKIDYDLDQTELAILFAHDNNGYTRYEAGQILLHRSFEAKRVDPLTLEAMGSILSDTSIEPSLKAELLDFPHEDRIAMAMDPIDVDSIISIRTLMLNQFVKNHEVTLRKQYLDLVKLDNNQHDQLSQARRKLKNRYLQLLMSGPNPPVDLAWQQFSSAQNMTDQSAAFAALSHIQCPQRQNAIQAFYDQWQHDDLVMDRWFSTQASSRVPESLREVKTLLDNKKFSMKNPNKVRSLLGAFARNNFANFHALDGSGYQFISGKIMELDALNPQIAARLAGVFTTWRRFDGQRQQLMKIELEKMVKNPSISADLYEIVHKSLVN